MPGNCEAAGTKSPKPLRSVLCGRCDVLLIWRFPRRGPRSFCVWQGRVYTIACVPALARVLLVLALALVLLAPRIAAAAPGFTQTCEQAVAKQQIDDLLERMRAIARAGPCTLERLDTSMFRTRIVWRRGDAVHEVLLGPRGCVVEPSHEGAALAFHASAELGEACPAVLAGVREFVGEPQIDLLPVVRGQAPEIPEDPDATEVGDPLVMASAAWLAALVLAGVAGVQHWRRIANAQRFALVLAGMFVLALLLRCSVVASLGNWYGGFLPAGELRDGLGELRFGASSAVLQMLVRAAAPWTVEVAFGLVRVTGALAVPLVMLLVRRLGGTMGASVVAGMLLAFAPIAVRLSASSSEHVLAGTLALAAWTVWLRSATDASMVPRALSLVLVVLAVLTRVDCWPQLSLIPLWTLLARPLDEPGASWRSLRRRLIDALGFWLGWAGLGVYAWFHVVLPSNHPGPDPAGIRATAEVLISQLWVAASEPPHWLSPVCFALLLLGVIAAAVARRWGLLLAALASLALIFIPLGRNLTHDGLTGARYFVLALPLLVVVAAQTGDAFEQLLGKLPGVWRRPMLGAGALVLALLEGLAARPGWRHEYTFQAEYLFLAEQLSRAEASGRPLEGCTLWFVSPRQATGEPDLDCCLAPDRSPLTLVAPSLRMRAFPQHRPPNDEHGCHLYYYGSLCSIDPELAPRVPEGVARIRAQCEALRTRGGADVLDRREVTDANLHPRWQAPPVVELFGRLKPRNVREQ